MRLNQNLSKNKVRQKLYESIKTVLQEARLVSSDAPVLVRIDRYLDQLPILKETIHLLLTTKYRFFVTNIDLLSPKPTIFRIFLKNNYYFDLKYIGKKTFQAKVSGKRYNLAVAGEVSKACNAISELLTLNKKIEYQQESSAPTTSSNVDNSDSDSAEAFDMGTSVDSDTGPAAIPKSQTTAPPENEEGEDPFVKAGLEPELD